MSGDWSRVLTILPPSQNGLATRRLRCLIAMCLRTLASHDLTCARSVSPGAELQRERLRTSTLNASD
jgi:hypothetical protein